MVAGELGRLVSVSRQTGAIHLFDVASGKALGVVEPGFVASEVRLSNDGRTLAAAGPGRVAIVDLAAPAVKAVIPIEGRPSALVFDRNAERLLIAHADAGRFDVADVARGDVVEAIDTGSVAGVVHLARTPGGSTAIAIDQKGVATLLDLAKWRVASRISLPGRH
jgi:DNA-binding beta-propeller fold protein YncE